MTPLKIESGIPIPASRKGPPKTPMRIALETMKEGDSVQVPRSSVKVDNIYKMAKIVGVKIVTRQVNCEGLRIWRVK